MSISLTSPNGLIPVQLGLYPDRPDLARLASTHNLLTTVWKDGNFVKRYTFDEVRENARK